MKKWRWIFPSKTAAARTTRTRLAPPCLKMETAQVGKKKGLKYYPEIISADSCGSHTRTRPLPHLLDVSRYFIRRKGKLQLKREIKWPLQR